MAKVSSTIVNKDLRDRVFNSLFGTITLGEPDGWNKVNDRQMGIILTDLNGVERYVRIGAIVAEEREDMTAQELMQAEIDKYNESVAKREEKKRNVKEKAEKDKAERERKAKEKGE